MEEQQIRHEVEFLGGTPVRIVATNCGTVSVTVNVVVGDKQPDSLRRFAAWIEEQEQLGFYKPRCEVT